MQIGYIGLKKLTNDDDHLKWYTNAVRLDTWYSNDKDDDAEQKHRSDSMSSIHGKEPRIKV